MKFDAKDVVIDADIARSAGTTEHPVSKNSRTVLHVIIKSDMSIVFCPILLEEWKKHRSKFAALWLSSMIARKKFLLISPKSVVSVDIESSDIDEDRKTIARKDAHVVDIAINSSNLILSNDTAARNVFCSLALQTTSLSQLNWIIPRHDANLFEKIVLNRDYMHPTWLISAKKEVTH